MPRKALITCLRAALVLLCLSTSSLVLGQTEETQNFAIEVLVLAYLDQTESVYRPVSETPTEAALDLLPPLVGNAGEPANTTDPRFVLLSDNLVLADAMQRLRRAAGYRPLAHLAWQQPALPAAASIPVRVRNDQIVSFAQQEFSDTAESAAAILEVDGIVTFEQRRYKHLRLDLTLHLESPADAVEDLASTDLTGLVPGNAPPLPYRTYRLSDNRRVSPGKIYYFNHSQFGVLVSIQAIEDDFNAESDSET